MQFALCHRPQRLGSRADHRALGDVQHHQPGLRHVLVPGVGVPLRAQDGRAAVLRDFRPFLAGVLAPRLALLAGSPVRIERLAVMARPAGLYGGEITGKGYVDHGKC